MEIEINGVRGALEVSGDTALGSMLRDLRSHLAQHGQVASELTVDGKPLTEKREEELTAKPVADFKLLQVTAILAGDLVTHVLAGLTAAIDALSKKSRAIAGLAQAGKRTEALGQLHGLTEDLGAFAEGIHHCFTFLETRTAVRVRSVERELEEFRSLLGRLDEIVRVADDVEFGDVLSYDVPENLEAWRSALEESNAALAAPPHEHEGRPGRG